MERAGQPYHIEYESVVERFDDGSSVKYDFANYHTHPDLYRSSGAPEIADKWSFMDPEYNDINHFLSEVDFAPQFRGTLLSVEFYDKSGVAVRKEENIYDTSVSRDFVEAGRFSGNRCYVYRYYLDSYPLKERRVTDYSSGSSPL